MSVADYLIDRSALARVLLRQATEVWEQRMGAGLITLCDLTELEALYSARSARDREAVQERLSRFTWCPTPYGVYRRARVVQRELTASAWLLLVLVVDTTHVGVGPGVARYDVR